MKYLPWGLVVALTLGFGLFCRQEGIAHEKNKATVAALHTVQNRLDSTLTEVAHVNDSLSGENAKLKRTIKVQTVALNKAQGKFASLLATWPLDSAPVSCFPYVQQVNACQEVAQNLRGQVAARDTIIHNDSIAVHGWHKLAVDNKTTADSLIKHWPKPSIFKDLTRPGSWITFLAGLLVGTRLSH